MAGRGLLLDRDGVINIDHGYVHRIEDFSFVPGILELARRAVDLGCRLVVVTNQAGIARGFYDEAQFRVLSDWMRQRFAEAGAPLSGVLHCPYLAQGRAPYDRDSWWRKPNPGMMREAVQRFDLDPTRSVLIGDMETDMRAGRAAGIGQCLLLRQEPPEPLTVADHVVPNLHEAKRRLEDWYDPVGR